MKISKSILHLFIFLLVFLPLSWFTLVLPYDKATKFLAELPSIVNSTLVNQYPDDLIISVKNGLVSLNRATPYCLLLKDGGGIGIVFDTVSDPKVKAFEEGGPYSKLCQPVAVVGRNYYMHLDQKEIKISQVPATVSFTVDKKTINDFVGQYLPQIISFGKNAYLALPFVAVLPVFLFFLLNNVWYSFFSRMMLKLFKVSPAVSSSEIYRTTLFFYNLITVVQWVLISSVLNQLLKQQVVISFPFMNTILISIATVWYFKNKTDSLPPASEVVTPVIAPTPVQPLV